MGGWGGGDFPDTQNSRSRLLIMRVGEGRAHSENKEGLCVAEGQRLKRIVRNEAARR